MVCPVTPLILPARLPDPALGRRLDDLSEAELTSLREWERTFEAKYAVVGSVVPPLELTPEALARYSGTEGDGEGGGGGPLYLSIQGVVLDVTQYVCGAALLLLLLLLAVLCRGGCVTLDPPPTAAGRGFYGPDGAYPFAGRECARALAKFSTEPEGEGAGEGAVRAGGAVRECAGGCASAPCCLLCHVAMPFPSNITGALAAATAAAAAADCCADLSGCSLAELDALRDWRARFYAKYPIVGRLITAAAEGQQQQQPVEQPKKEGKQQQQQQDEEEKQL